MLGVSMALNYKTTRNSRTWLQGKKHGLKQFEVEGWKDSAIAKAEKLTAKSPITVFLLLAGCSLITARGRGAGRGGRSCFGRAVQ